MAQRIENEETELKVPETMTLCTNNCGVTGNPSTNNCGVTGNPSTNNMCQNCFNATTTTATIASACSSSATSQSLTITSRPLNKRSDSSPPKTTTFRRIAGLNRPVKDDDPAACTEKKVVNRCSGCKRRVGLTGFRCRCGELFCADHRYSDRHDCGYDYKTVGREAIARENPVVKAAKLIKV